MIVFIANPVAILIFVMTYKAVYSRTNELNRIRQENQKTPASSQK